MHTKIKMVAAVVLTGALSFLGAGREARAQVFSAPTSQELKVVMTKITGIGSQKGNTSARPVGVRGVEMLVTGTGDRFEVSKSGQFERVDAVSQLALMLPSKVSGLSFLQELCIDRIKALQSGANGKQAIEITFEGKRIGTGSFLVSKLVGCSDVTKTAAIVTPKPTPTPRPTATATPVAGK